MNTPLAQSAESNILRFKELATEDQFQQMIESIKNFDIDLNGCGFEAIQAKVKLNQIKDLTEEEIKAFCQLFKN